MTQPVNTSLPPQFARTQTVNRLKGHFTADDIEAFRQTCSQSTRKDDYPLAVDVQANVPIYDASSLLVSERDEVMAELHRCLLSGPGVFVVRQLVPASDRSVIDAAERAFRTIIDREKQQKGKVKGDHFAPAGANDRIWNSFQKFAEVDPESFARYYANEALDLICEAWLGPGYAMTSQTNIVKPGGKPQEPHRDYHLGFQAEHTAARFPIISQIASQLLTLQGAVAHTDMPIDSGPTQLLPYSQHFDNGYVAYRHPEFTQVFHEKMVQLPLKKGDGLFFNPALFHAAGENRTKDFNRSANLLQVSACWGKAMESVDRGKIVRLVWPVLRGKGAAPVNGGGGGAAVEGGLAEELGEKRVAALFRMIAEGYSFPTNLDMDPPPPGGHCPETQLDMLFRANGEQWDAGQLDEELDRMDRKRLP